MKPPGKRWRLIRTAPLDIIETKHGSRREAYAAAGEVRRLYRAGATSITGMSVHHWDRKSGRWCLFENLTMEQ